MPLEMHDLSIGELLGGPHRFSIPPFQREYAWERAHARQLLDDISIAASELENGIETIPCFLGSILVYKDAEVGRLSMMEVIDGQQRLVTLSIIYALLRDLAKDGSDRTLSDRIAAPDGPRVLLREGDREIFSRAIQEPGGTRKRVRLGAHASATHLNILENRAEILRLLVAMSEVERRRLARFMNENCRVVLIAADNFDYAYHIFLSINERGKDLTVEDIFQAELLGPLTTEEQRRFAPIIDQVGKYRRENSQNISRAKTFFTHIAAANGWRGRTIVSSIRQAIRAAGGARKFSASTFVPMAEAYLALSGRGPVPQIISQRAAEAIEHLQMLEEHGDDDWLATAMLAWTRLSRTAPELEQVLAALDRFAHIVMAIGFGGTARKRHYATINAAIVAGEPWDRIIQRLKPARDMERQALRNIAQRLHESDKATCRLFLLRVDAFLSRRPLSYYRALPSYPLRQENALTVEHLLPKGANVNSVEGTSWLELFPDAAHRTACAQYFGNLTPVTSIENAEVGQRAFAAKKSVLARNGTHPIKITDDLKSVREWDYQALAQRHDTLMRAAAQIWTLPGEYPLPPRPPKPKSKK